MSEGYDVGGDFGGGFTAAQGACAEKCICDALNGGLASIAESLTTIDNTLSEKIDQGCKIVSECQAEINELIDAAVSEALAPIEEAQATIQGFLAEQQIVLDQYGNDIATLLYEEGQSLNQPYIPPIIPPKRTFYGWCDLNGGEALVTDSQASPGDSFKQVAFGDEEDAVLSEAQQICRTYEAKSPFVYQTKPIPQTGAVSNSCDINIYTGTTALRAIVGNQGQLFSVAGFAEVGASIASVGLDGINFGNLGSVIVGVMNRTFDTPPLVAHTMLPMVASALGCNNAEWVAGMEVLAAIGMITKFVGLDVSEFADPIKYALNSSCRRKFLGPGDALDAYLADAITPTELDIHFSIAGLCPSEVTKKIASERSKPEPEQIIMMRHRGIIGQSDYGRMFRQLGYLDPAVPENIFKISEHLPDIATAGRVVQSGAIDEKSAEQLGLSEDLDLLLGGVTGDWIHGNGISEETAELFWQSHWITPGVSTLFEMLHRLSGDKQFDANGELTDDVAAALKSLGIPKFWRDRMQAIAFAPLLKRDIRVAYTSGALSDDDLESAISKTGHDQQAIDVITKELKPARRHAILGHIALRSWAEQILDATQVRQQLSDDGYYDDVITQAMADTEFHFATSTWCEAYVRGSLPRADLLANLQNWGVTSAGSNAIAERLSWKIVDHQSIRNYIAGTINRGTAYNEMSTFGMQSATINQLLDNADDTRDNSLASECLGGIKSQYVTGGITNAEATDYLRGFGLDINYVNDAMSSFDCRRKAEGREVGVEKLCNWLYIGTIDQSEMYRRLLRMGYDEASASLLLIDCVNANTLKAVKKQQAEAKELQRTLDAERKAVDKVNATNQRNAERLAKLRSAQAKLRANRQQQYISASEKVYKGSDADLPTVLATVRAAIDSVKSAYGLTEDESLKIAILAAEQMKGLDISAYRPLLEQLAGSAASAEPTPTLADVGEPDSSNGAVQPS